MKNLTPRQNEILNFIRQTIQQQQVAPTLTEISDAMGFRSVNAAKQHVLALEKKQAISLSAGKARGIKLLESLNTQHAGLPVVGRVAAGSPILASEHIEEYHSLNPDLFHPSADYLLRVQGDSMRDIGILNDDLLAVHRQPQADNGQIVVARVDDEVTVKRLKVEGSTALLLPENRDYQAIEIDLSSQELFIEGIAVGVIRNQGFSHE